MQVKRFLAADMRRALEMVRQELGPDAIILSSSRTKDGVEILTTQANSQLPPEPEQSSTEAFLGANSVNTSNSGQQHVAAIEKARERLEAEQRLEASAEEFLRSNQRVNAGIPRQAPERRVAADQRPAVAGSAAERYGVNVSSSAETLTEKKTDDLGELQTQMAEMRLLLEEQLTQMLGAQGKPGSPVLASVGRRLERMGMPKNLSVELINGCRRRSNLAHSWSDALASLSHQLPVDGSDPVSRGGVFALVGPTGVGKTTTIGKLAARYVLEHGARDLALVTTDTQRIGGQDQLRALGRILGVTVRVVDDANSLESVLYSLRRCALVLIDSAGFSHGDPRLAGQMKALAEQRQIQKLLVLSSNSQTQMLKASVHAYGGASLQGCIFTKLDESASLGEALSVAMQTQLPIVYTTDGQDIPKDIDLARAHTLVAKAAALLKQSPAEAQSRSSEVWNPTGRLA